MPIFEYECAACKQRFELLIRSSEQAPACPGCGGVQLKKLISRFNAVGSGAPEAPDFGGCGRCGSTTPGVCNFD